MDNFQRCKGELVLTHERLKQLVHYDAETGQFTRLSGAGGIRRGSVAGYVSAHGYLRLGVDGFIFRAHPLAWFWMYGKWPKHMLDHVNGDRMDNRIANLREAVNGENQWNKRLNKNNSSGFKGVRFHKEDRRWVAAIRCKGRRIWLGRFDTPEEAHEVYCLAAAMLHGEFANHGTKEVCHAE